MKRFYCDLSLWDVKVPILFFVPARSPTSPCSDTADRRAQELQKIYDKTNKIFDNNNLLLSNIIFFNRFKIK